MAKDELIKLAKEMADRLPLFRTQDDLRNFTETLTIFTVDWALNAELEYHLEMEDLPNVAMTILPKPVTLKMERGRTGHPA